jgi:hypothetical protein
MDLSNERQGAWTTDLGALVQVKLRMLFGAVGLVRIALSPRVEQGDEDI